MKGLFIFGGGICRYIEDHASAFAREGEEEEDDEEDKGKDETEQMLTCHPSHTRQMQRLLKRHTYFSFDKTTPSKMRTHSSTTPGPLGVALCRPRTSCPAATRAWTLILCPA